MTEPAAPPLSSEEAAAERQATRKLWLVRLALAVVGIALLWTLWYALIGRIQGLDRQRLCRRRCGRDDAAGLRPRSPRSPVDRHPAGEGRQVLVRIDADRLQARPGRGTRPSSARPSARRRAISPTPRPPAPARSPRAQRRIDRADAQLVSQRQRRPRARPDRPGRRQQLAASGAVSGDELTQAQREPVPHRPGRAGRRRPAVLQAQADRSRRRGRSGPPTAP